jgi:hypothetical protein
MSHRGRILIGLVFLLAVLSAGYAQEIPPLAPPDPVEDFAEGLAFDAPTRIEGRLLTFDTYDPAIWIQWTHLFQGGRWLAVKTETQLLVYPRDEAMMRFFRALEKGTALRMTVQRDGDGKRRVIELDST